MPESWHDINDPGFFKPKREEPNRAKPVEYEAGGRVEPGQGPEVRLIIATWEPGPDGFQFNKKCLLKIKAEFLKETFRKKLTCSLFAIYEGTEYDLNHQADAQLEDDGTATAQLTLYYADAYYHALQDDPAVTCQYMAKVTHPTATGDLESALLDMPNGDNSPEPELKSMAWKSAAAHRGETVAMEAEFTGCNGNEEAAVEIFEYDYDGNHDPVATVQGAIRNGKLEASWNYEYQDDVDDIPTEEEIKRTGGDYHPPEYFFVIKLGNKKWGEKQESGLLQFEDWIEIELQNETGNPMADEPYICHLPDGKKHEGNLDENGFARVEPAPPGPVEVEFPNFPTVTIKR
jgi:hypothetical protein